MKELFRTIKIQRSYAVDISEMAFYNVVVNGLANIEKNLI